jgi:hypothetical protein
MTNAIERSTMRKIYLRLLPLAVVSYLLAYIDRINVSFAGLRMRDDLNMPAAASGFALGTFYWGYSIFELPSNLIMEKLGARLWIARIMRGEVHMPKETPPTDQEREIMTVRSAFLPGRTGNSRIERLRDRARPFESSDLRQFPQYRNRRAPNALSTA